MPTNTVVPLAAPVSDSITPRTNVTVSAPSDWTHAVNAPSGSVRAQDVPTAQWVTHPRDAAESSASRAMRLLPTPAAPQITIPDEPLSDSAASMSRISSKRPVNGHANRTYTG
jgi:hypothetical protein